MQYLTTDYQTFRGLKSGRDVYFNSDWDRFIAIYMPSMEELDKAIAEYEEIRIRNYWEEVLLQHQREVGERSQRSKREGDYLYGFVLHRQRLGYHLLRPEAVQEAVQQMCGGQRLKPNEVRSLSLKEQKAILECLCPSTRWEAQHVLNRRGLTHCMSVDLRAILHTGSSSAQSFLEQLASTILAGSALDQKYMSPHGMGFARITEFLSTLHEQGWILFPSHGIGSTTLAGFTLHPCYRSEGYLAFCATLGEHSAAGLKEEEGRGMVFGQSKQFLLASTVRDIPDISPDLLTAWEESRRLYRSRSLKSACFRVSDGVKRLWVAQYPEEPLVWQRADGRVTPVEERWRLRTFGDFGWVVEADPRLARWVEPLKQYVAQLKGLPQQPTGELNSFLDYLSTLDSPPVHPEEVMRHDHIASKLNPEKNTYCRYLRSVDISQRTKNGCLGRLHNFFKWYKEKLKEEGHPAGATFENPVDKETDRFLARRNNTKTYRIALPGDVLRLLLDILTKDDYAFARDPERFPFDYPTVYDRETGGTVKVWWPGRAIAMHLHLVYALRNHQVLSLDSGEGDYYHYDRDTLQRIPNPDRTLRTRGRQQGALQVMTGPDGKPHLALNVITNKTALYGVDNPGFTIIWVPPEIVQAIHRMQDWLRRYGERMTAPVRYREKLDKNKTVTVTLYPLFRDPTLRDPRQPASWRRIRNFWSQLLLEAETHLRRQGVNVTFVTKTTDKYLPVDGLGLHALRVSNITYLLEQGVPLEYVKEIVGHAAIAMTLRYFRSNPWKLREMLQQAYDALGKTIDESIIEQLEDWELVMANERDSNGMRPGIEAAKANRSTGLVRIDIAGICPGTSCADGAKSGGPVPGSRCPLCKYWITGPAFLIGQIAEFNRLVKAIRLKGEDLRGMRDEQINLEDSQDSIPKARAKLTSIQTRIETMERQLDLDLAELVERLKAIMASNHLMADYDRLVREKRGDGKLPALISQLSPEDLRAELVETSDFALTTMVCQAAEVFPELEQLQVVLEREQALNKLLTANDIEPFLLRLPRKMALRAANEMSELLLDHVGAEYIDDVVGGKVRVQKFPGLDERLRRWLADFSGRRDHPHHLLPGSLQSGAEDNDG